MTKFQHLLSPHPCCREALAQRHVSLGLTPLDMQRLALLSEGLADATATATADSITHYWHASTSTYIHPEGSIHSCGNAFLTRPSHAYSTTPGGIAVLSGTALEAEVVLAAMEGMRGRELDAHAWMEMAVQTVHGGSAELLREVRNDPWLSCHHNATCADRVRL